MSSGSAGVAKTVSFSPLRPEKTAIKVTLDAPYQLKWPHIAPENAERLLEELKKSLSGVKALLSSKFNQSPSNGGTRKRTRKRKTRKPSKKEAKPDSGGEEKDGEPPTKKLCQETSTAAQPLTVNEATPSPIDDSAGLDTSIQPAAPQSVQDNGRRAQLVVGTNAVTRSLEEGSLRVGVVCLTAKPAFLHRHLLQLAATRRVPMAAVPHLSQTISPLLGIKSSLAVGIKKVGEGEVDCYSELVDMVTKLAPPISIPWLTSDLSSSAGGDVQAKVYRELNVKKVITRPKRKNKLR